MPPEQRARLTPAQLKAYSKGPYALRKNPVGTAFTYDSEGRVTQKRERNVLFEETTTISYNEHGVKASERKTVKVNSILPTGPSYSYSFDADGNPVISNSASEHPARPERDYMPPDSDIRYAYRYDNYGNWTARTETRADGSSEYTRRMLTYH